LKTIATLQRHKRSTHSHEGMSTTTHASFFLVQQQRLFVYDLPCAHIRIF